MDTNNWLFLFAAIQAGGVLLTFFRADIRLLHKNAQVTATPSREKVLAVLAIGSILLSGVGFYRQSELNRIPEFDDPQSNLVSAWGSGPGSCHIVANGDLLWSYRSNYKLTIGCYAYDGLGNLLDAPQLQVGNLYDISRGQIKAMVGWGPGFADYLNKTNAFGLYHALLLVPNGVGITQFSTLRQARALGVRVLFNGAASNQPSNQPRQQPR